MLRELYDKLLNHFGPQNWWPAESPFEVCVGAILTQNTNWSNVAKAIAQLKARGLMTFETLSAAPDAVIAECIRPAGYFNLKTKRLRHFLTAVRDDHGGFAALFELDTIRLREALLAITGIGPETADSICLYAFGKPVFVVDTYTKRISVRHRLIDEEADYFQLQEFFESRLVSDVSLYNEYHALLVKLGSQLCRKTAPKCTECPLKEFNGGPCL